MLYVGKKKPAGWKDAHVRVETYQKDLPSFKSFCDELKANGCTVPVSPKGQSSNDKSAAAMPDSQLPSAEKPRIHFISLLLDSIVDFCDFLRKAMIHIPEEEVKEAFYLFDIILCLRYDINSYRILESLDAALLALLGALDDTTWKQRLPSLSYCLATSYSMKTTKGLRFKVIKDLPCGFRIFDERMALVRQRCAELQQYSAALLLDIIMEPLDSSKTPDLSIVSKYPMDLEARIDGEEWFQHPNILTEVSDVQATNIMSHFTRVELLLRLADMLLWPCVLTAMNTSESRTTTLTSGFLRRWSSFLGAIPKRIKTLNPEEQAVKTMANFLKLQYDQFAEETS